jgi:hypothetical protein
MGIYIQSCFYGCETTKIKCFMVLMLGTFHNDGGKKANKFCVTYEECLTLFFLKENGHYTNDTSFVAFSTAYRMGLWAYEDNPAP